MHIVEILRERRAKPFRVWAKDGRKSCGRCEMRMERVRECMCVCERERERECECECECEWVSVRERDYVCLESRTIYSFSFLHDHILRGHHVSPQVIRTSLTLCLAFFPSIYFFFLAPHRFQIIVGWHLKLCLCILSLQRNVNILSHYSTWAHGLLVPNIFK